MTYQPQPGDRIRIVRHRPDGSRQMTQTGTATTVRPDNGGIIIDFHDDDGRRRLISHGPHFTRTMKGWTQTITPA